MNPRCAPSSCSGTERSSDKLASPLHLVPGIELPAHFAVVNSEAIASFTQLGVIAKILVHLRRGQRAPRPEHRRCIRPPRT